MEYLSQFCLKTYGHFTIKHHKFLQSKLFLINFPCSSSINQSINQFSYAKMLKTISFLWTATILTMCTDYSADNFNFDVVQFKSVNNLLLGLGHSADQILSENEDWWIVTVFQMATSAGQQ